MVCMLHACWTLSYASLPLASASLWLKAPPPQDLAWRDVPSAKIEIALFATTRGLALHRGWEMLHERPRAMRMRSSGCPRMQIQPCAELSETYGCSPRGAAHRNVGTRLGRRFHAAKSTCTGRRTVAAQVGRGGELMQRQPICCADWQTTDLSNCLRVKLWP